MHSQNFIILLGKSAFSHCKARNTAWLHLSKLIRHIDTECLWWPLKSLNGKNLFGELNVGRKSIWAMTSKAGYRITVNIFSIYQSLFEGFKKVSSSYLFLKQTPEKDLGLPKRLRWGSLTKLPSDWVFWKGYHCISSRDKSFVRSMVILKRNS